MIKLKPKVLPAAHPSKVPLMIVKAVGNSCAKNAPPAAHTATPKAGAKIEQVIPKLPAANEIATAGERDPNEDVRRYPEKAPRAPSVTGTREVSWLPP